MMLQVAIEEEGYVTLLERRPAFMNPDTWVSIPVA